MHISERTSSVDELKIACIRKEDDAFVKAVLSPVNQRITPANPQPASAFEETSLDSQGKRIPWKMEFELMETRNVGSIHYDLTQIGSFGNFAIVKCEYLDSRVHPADIWMVVRQDILALENVPKGEGVLVTKRGSNERYFVTEEMALLAAKTAVKKGRDIDLSDDYFVNNYFGRDYNDTIDYLEDRESFGNLKETEVLITQLSVEDRSFQGVAEIAAKNKIHLVYVTGKLGRVKPFRYPNPVISLDQVSSIRYYNTPLISDFVYAGLIKGNEILPSMSGRTLENMYSHLLASSK